MSCATWLKLSRLVTNNAIAVVFFPLESCQTTKTNWIYKYENDFIQDISVYKLNELNIGEGGGVGGVPCLFVLSSCSGAIILSARNAIPVVSRKGSCY